tara:strand:- start:6904 stop:7083 length:180 start_codon:yes stop_codon:yes gene_type:complete
MLFFFLIGILFGIYLEQELDSLPKLKPFLVSTLHKFQQRSSTDHNQKAPDQDEKVPKKE